MRHFQVFLGGLVLLTCAATAQQTSTSPSPAGANDVSALEQKIRDLEDRMVMMEGQIRQLKAKGAGSELGLQAVIDPYARGDFFLSFGEEGVNLEEGYITFTALPAGFVAKAGKMRAAFGKVNTLHNHVLPWVERPLVTQDLVGGEDGLDDAGVSVEHIIPAPKGIFLEATGQLFRGDSGDAQHPLFRASTKSDVSAVAHLRTYKDITESTNVDIGFSYGRGHNDAGSNFLTQLYGIDATLRWKPLRRSIYHSFVGRGEFIWSQRQQPPFEQRAFGFYTSADYQLGRRWFLGGRYDH